MDAYKSPQQAATRAKKPPPTGKKDGTGKNGPIVGKINNRGRVLGEIGKNRQIRTSHIKIAAGTANTITTEIVEIGTRSNSYLKNHIQGMDDTPS